MKRAVQPTNNQLSVDLAVIAEKVSNIEQKVTSIEAKLEKDYVTVDEHDPIKRIVYGTVGVILLAVIGALIALVIKQV
jgi:tetrahydromethanopterin S-methyltransferase subunit B